jgi:hypothetical protein
MELTKSHRFDSSGLNLTFERLLLGVSLWILVEGTRSNPCQLGCRIRNAFAHAEGVSVMFCRRLKALRVSKQRL